MECLRDFIVDLQRLDASPDAAFGKVHHIRVILGPR
jgi:hypothetical protein